MLELLNHIKNVLVLSGLEGARLDSAMFLIEDKLESTIVLSNTVEVKEVEKVIEKVVEIEVIPEEVEEELDSLKKSLKEVEEELNDTMNILEDTLDEKDQLEARCTELHEQNEYLLSQLEEPEQVTFEEPEEISNEDILANSMNEEVDEVAIEKPEKKVNMGSHKPKRSISNRSTGHYDEYGNPKQNRKSLRNDDDTHVFLNYYKQIKSGELNETNLTPELITKIHTLACTVNNGSAPREVAQLYFNIMNGDE